MKSLPAGKYSRRDGALNLHAHDLYYPYRPDLGPKMYNAYVSLPFCNFHAKRVTEVAQASILDDKSSGTTRLHMDMADAVNLMQHAELCPDGQPGGAVWDIFRPEDSESLRQFLSGLKNHDKLLHPIHGQRHYLGPGLLRRLSDQYQVQSYRIYQRPGQAVFIPAGCAHQVNYFVGQEGSLADLHHIGCKPFRLHQGRA